MSDAELPPFPTFLASPSDPTFPPQESTPSTIPYTVFPHDSTCILIVKLIFAAVANSSLDDRLVEEVASGWQSCNEGLGEGQADVALVVKQGGVERSRVGALKSSQALQTVARATPAV